MFASPLARLSGLRGRRASLAAVLFGGLSALALPPFHVIPVLLAAVPALLALIGGQPRMRDAAWIGFWFGFGHHVVGLYWITDAILVVAAEFWWLVPFAVPALAAVLALFIALPAALAWRARHGVPRALALAGGWVLADLARQFVLTGFPWNLWGYVWAVPGVIGDTMLQPAALIGVHGLTLITLLVASAPALGMRAIAGGIAALVLWAGFGAWRLALPPPAAPDLQAVLVQGNVAEGGTWDQARRLETFRRYLRLTHDAVAAAHGGPLVVIWPETASPFLLESDPNARAAVADAAMGATVISGTIRFDRQNRPRNSLVAILPDAQIGAVYDKAHLVPFGEYEPDWMPMTLMPMPGGGFARGSGPETLHIPGLPPVGALICYEVIFPGAVVEAGSRPDWIVNITNDAWFGNSTGPRQHLAAARVRAVEEGLPLMRAANTGISAGFDAFGREEGRLGIDIDGSITVKLTGAVPATPFARFGLLIPAVLAAATLAIGSARRRTLTVESLPV